MNEDMRMVVRYLAEQFSSQASHRVDTPFVVEDLSFDDRVGPALRRLIKAQPPYIEGIMAAQADYPVVITDLTERGWEAAEAAGDRRDAGPGGPASTPVTSAISATGSPFQVALSFAGEQREYVQRVAVALSSLGVEHFYDDNQKVALWGTNQVETLQRIYLEDSSSVVMFISKEYAENVWPTAERRATLSRALREKREYVLPVRFDATVLRASTQMSVTYWPTSSRLRSWPPPSQKNWSTSASRFLLAKVQAKDGHGHQLVEPPRI